jgi:integral membrane sensor domain MASE1
MAATRSLGFYFLRPLSSRKVTCAQDAVGPDWLLRGRVRTSKRIVKKGMALPMTEAQTTRLPTAPKFFGIFILYFFVSLALGVLSLTLAANYDGVAIIWWPAGSALVSLVFIDMRLWPSIVLASLVSNLYFGSSIQASVGIGIGSALGAIVATVALRALGPWNNLSIFFQALKLGTVGAAISATISASLGVSSLYFWGILPVSALATSWARWVLGDSVGVFLFSSFILIFHMLLDGRSTDSKS